MANPQTYSGAFSYINLFQTLVAKADAWHRLFEKNASIDAAKEEISTYESAFRLIDYVARTYDSDEARLFLSKIRYALHGKPIDIAYTLYNLTRDQQYLE